MPSTRKQPSGDGLSASDHASDGYSPQTVAKPTPVRRSHSPPEVQPRSPHSSPSPRASRGKGDAATTAAATAAAVGSGRYAEDVSPRSAAAAAVADASGPSGLLAGPHANGRAVAEAEDSAHGPLSQPHWKEVLHRRYEMKLDSVLTEVRAGEEPSRIHGEGGAVDTDVAAGTKCEAPHTPPEEAETRSCRASHSADEAVSAAVDEGRETHSRADGAKPSRSQSSGSSGLQAAEAVAENSSQPSSFYSSTSLFLPHVATSASLPEQPREPHSRLSSSPPAVPQSAAASPEDDKPLTAFPASTTHLPGSMLLNRSPSPGGASGSQRYSVASNGFSPKPEIIVTPRDRPLNAQSLPQHSQDKAANSGSPSDRPSARRRASQSEPPFPHHRQEPQQGGAPCGPRRETGSRPPQPSGYTSGVRPGGEGPNHTALVNKAALLTGVATIALTAYVVVRAVFGGSNTPAPVGVPAAGKALQGTADGAARAGRAHGVERNRFAAEQLDLIRGKVIANMRSLNFKGDRM